MQRISKKRSGYKAPWKIAAALKWRLRHGGTLDDAEGELVSLCKDGVAILPENEQLTVIEATGLVTGSHPERDEEPLWWRPFVDPASSHRLGTPRHAVIRASQWVDLRVVRDAQGQPTNELEFKDYLSPAWEEVELEDRHTAMKAWRVLIKNSHAELPVADKIEEESQPTKKGEYEGDLEAFMTSPASRAARLSEMSAEGVAKEYLRYHERRRQAGQLVPRLPGKSNRLRDVRNMVEKIRARLLNQQRPAAVT